MTLIQPSRPNSCNKSKTSSLLSLLTGALFSLLLFSSDAVAATYFVSPTAKSTGTGSQNAPWPSVAAALATGKIRGGDQILLQSGNHGFLRIKGARFSSPVLIAAAPGAKARVERIDVQSSKNITFRDLLIWPEKPTSETLFLVRTSRNSPNMEFQRLDVRSAEDAGNYRRWNKSTWLARKVNGILAEGPDSEVSNSTFMGLYHAVSVNGDRSSILNNRIVGYSGDGTRALGNYSTLRGNTIQDCVKIDENHDDAFMTWSLGANGKIGAGTIEGMVIENNLIEEWNGPRNHPFICELQGIFLGGYLNDLVIQNNVVSVSAYHGITAYGVTRGKIVNNTLVNSRGPSKTQPWIGLWGNIDRGSTQVTVANNIAPLFKVNSLPKIDIQQSRNVVLIYPQQQLRAPFKGDYRPAKGSSLIDGAKSQFAPANDIDGTTRTLGSSADIGAYEVQ